MGSKVRSKNLLTRQRLMSLVLLAMLISLRLWDPLPLKLLRYQTFDFYQKILPRAASASQVAVVDIDEESLAHYGQWPWSRRVVADLIRSIVDSGAKTIGLDIVFAERDRLSPKNFAKFLDPTDQETADVLEHLPDNDAILADTLRQAQVVVSQSVLQEANSRDTDLPPKAPPIIESGGDARSSLVSYPGLLRTIPELEGAAAGHGVITLGPEPDGVVRRVPALMRVGSHILPALSLELYRVAAGGTTLSVHSDSAGIRGVSILENFIPTDQSGRMWVHFSRNDPKRYLPALKLLNGTGPFESLKDKLVLIGTSAVGLEDVKMTPVEGRVPGVEVHAQLLDMILNQTFLTRPNWALATEVMSLLFFGLMMIILVPSFQAVSSMALMGTVTVGLIGASWYGYKVQGLLFDVSFGIGGLMALYALLSYSNYVREEASRRRIRSIFSQYLSPTLVDQLARQSGQLQLGGETKCMTVMFCDVRHFTTISEELQSDPQGLTRLINSLLTPLTNVILSSKGTIDKYIGDAIMAFWNAPLDDPDHAVHACQAALGMLRALERLNETRFQEAKARNQPFLPLTVGIGINTGDCVVGNMGSEHRFDYSVLGDSVNMASRLEGQCKTYELEIVIGPQTAELVRDRFALLEVDLIALKGKRESARTYTVVGDNQLRKAPEFQRLVETHSAMLNAFRSREWHLAQALLEDCRKNIHAPLGVYKEYGDRIVQYQRHPPPADWEGVHLATSK